MNWLKFFKKPAVGVDVGSRTIKGIKLKKINGRIYLDRYFFHDLAKTSKGFPEQSNPAETLKASIEMNCLTEAEASVNIGDDEVFNFNFELPQMKDSEMRYAVAHEIQESINIPIEELAFDYVVANTPAAAPGGTVKVKTYCAKRAAVLARTAILQASKLKPGAVESDVLALVAMLGFNDYLAPEKNYALLDLGESHITTALIAGGELVFSKSGKTGFGSINRALRENLDLGYTESEPLKLRHDFNQGGSQDTPSGQLIDEVYFEIFKDVKETLEFFSEQLQHTPNAHSPKIDRIFLVGGGSRIRNIEKVFELLFKTPATVVNPFKNIQIQENSPAAQDEKLAHLGAFMATAVGLALRKTA